jgi:hypothetical protein
MNAGTAATITGLSAPVNATDATTKTYVDAADALKLNLSGGTLSGDIAMGGNKVTGLGAPTNTADAATKLYVDTAIANLIDSAPETLDTLNELAAALGDDPNFATTVTNELATKLSLAGGTMTGDIVLGSNNITSTTTPATDDTLTRKGYVDTQVATRLPLAGGTMTGEIAMGTSKIVNLGNPTGNQDAATKIYVDNADVLKLNLSGGTMTGNIVMGANKVTSTATPTADDDLTRKAYVDSILGSAVAAADSAAAALVSETNAASSASAAATSESNAASSASAAATSESNAALSASAAATSETNAANSASAAATSETNAATSETNAATSETNAANSASAAATSETNAATSETNAATSETNAATSETNAANSASAAANSATDAAESFDEFDDRYLGSKTSAPTLDNDGDPLLEGAIYWNSTVKGLFIWNGTAWSPAVFDTADALFGANNLSDVANAGTARTNLGLGSTDSPTFATVNATTVDLGDWTITEVGGSLYFAANGTNRMKLDASGNVQITGAIDTVATIS